MKTPAVVPLCASSIEVLECRVAPAGLVTVEYTAATGVLILTGDDLANTVSVFPTAAGFHRVEVSDGTALSTGGTFYDFGKLTSVAFLGGGENDVLTLLDLNVTQLDFTGGTGADTLSASNLAVKGNVTIATGGGMDEADFGGLQTSISGNLSLEGDQLAVSFSGIATKVGGSLIGKAGPGGLRIAADGAGPLSIGKGVQVDAVAGSALLQLEPSGPVTIGKLPTGESVRISGGPDSANLRLDGGNTTLAGGISITGGSGVKAVDIASERFVVKVGRLASGHSILLSGTGGAQILVDVLSFTAAGGIELAEFGGTRTVQISTPDGKTTIGRLPSGHSVLFGGGPAGDDLRIEAGNVALAGGIEFAAGAGDNVLDLRGTNGMAKIGKLASGASILFAAAEGDDSIALQFANATLAGGIDFSAGDGANHLQLIVENSRFSLGKLSSGQSIAYRGGIDSDWISLEGGKVTLLGALTFEAGAGSNYIDLRGEGAFFSIGRMPTGTSLLYTGGADQDEIYSNANAVTFAGGITFAVGGGANKIAFEDSASVKIGSLEDGESILFAGGGGNDSVTLTAAALDLKGSIELVGEGGNDEVTVNGTRTNIGKSRSGLSVRLEGGPGNDEINLNGNVGLAGTISFAGGSGDDSLTSDLAGTLASRGGIIFVGGPDRDRLNLGSELLQVAGTLTFHGDDGRDEATITANGFIGDSVMLDAGSNTAGTQDIVVTSLNRYKGLTLNWDLNVIVDGTGTDSLTARDVVVKGGFLALLGNGASSVALDNLFVSGSFALDTREGADEVAFERLPFFGTSLIGKLATITTGGGDDTLLIGTPLSSGSGVIPDPTRVRFLGGLTVDGGAGTNTRNDVAAENDFSAASSEGLDTFTVIVP